MTDSPEVSYTYLNEITPVAQFYMRANSTCLYNLIEGETCWFSTFVFCFTFILVNTHWDTIQI